jgi:3-phenylpropionate/trans-cinnamate dioxygenase ferredoxin reductase subunit
VAFGKALLATGAMVNILRVEGAENEGIHYLRAFGNADAIRADAEAAEHVVLVGGSYIGCEVAASLTARGTKCTILAMEDVALSRTFGEDAGRWFQGQLESHGVTFHGGETLSAFEGDGRVGAGPHRERAGDRVRHGRRRRRGQARCDARRARRARGRERDRLRLEAADLGAGSTPPATAAPTTASSTAAAAGRALGRGDAAGNARGRNMLGDEADYDVVPYFFSDLADWASLEYVGPRRTGTRRSGAATAMRRVLTLVPEGRQGRRRAQRRPLRRPRRGAPPARRAGRRLRARETIADADSDLSSLGA